MPGACNVSSATDKLKSHGAQLKEDVRDLARKLPLSLGTKTTRMNDEKCKRYMYGLMDDGGKL